MKKLLTFCLLLTVTASMTFAQTPSQTITNDEVAKKVSNANIEFDRNVIDYGTIKQNSDGERIFTFTNSGTEALIITNSKGSCGCTVPQWPREPIAPGATGEIKVKYATNRLGSFNKTVTVSSNADAGTKILRIKGNVIKEVADEGVPKKEQSIVNEAGDN